MVWKGYFSLTEHAPVHMHTKITCTSRQHLLPWKGKEYQYVTEVRKSRYNPATRLDF